MYKIRLQRSFFFFYVVANDRSDKRFLRTSKFCPLGLFAPDLWLYTFIKSWKVVYKGRGVCVWGGNSGLTSLSTIFQSYHDGCDRELNAHFYSAASLKYHVPDTWYDTTPSHIILTLGRPVLALPRGAASTIFNDFGMSRPGIEPVTSRSPERTLYQLSYRGR